jgi:outer membrane murein-binding lipoprotein Lpp
MPQRKIDSLSSDGAQLVASLLARIDGLMAQIAARDDRIDELLAQVKALNARIAELEAKRGGPPKTPDNSSLPPSRGQKANAEPPAAADDLRLHHAHAGGRAFRSRPLHHGRILVHRFNVLRESRGDDRARAFRYVRRYCSWGRRGLYRGAARWDACGSRCRAVAVEDVSPRIGGFYQKLTRDEPEAPAARPQSRAG